MGAIAITKLIFAVIIFFIAYIFGALPLRKFVKSPRRLECGEYFARGIFLGVALIHMLPNATHLFAQLYPQSHYPWVVLIVAATIFIVQFIEQGIVKLVYHHQQVHTWRAFLLLVLLSIHSVIMGAALGISSSIIAAMVLFVAIIAHKGAEAFALGMHMQHSHLSARATKSLLILFALMTPVGIFIGVILSGFLSTFEGQFIEILFSAIAAGTFIYIAAFNHVHLHTDDCQDRSFIDIMALGMGILLMAIVAVWL